MPRPPKALIFDLDGVLIDSEKLHRKTWAEALSALSIGLGPEREAHLHGRTGEQVIGWLREQPDPWAASFDAEALIRLKREFYHKLMPTELHAVPGVDPFLRAHKSAGMPLALVTSARLKLVGRVMLQFNWRNIFGTLVGVDHVSRPKPDPEPYEHAIARMKLAPADCLVFEDSDVGIRSATAAGARVCGVTTTMNRVRLIESGARWTIENFHPSAELELALSGAGAGGLFAALLRMTGRG